MSDPVSKQPGQRRDEGVEPPKGVESPWVLLRSAGFHPFIFKRMIRAVDPAAGAGDVVNLYDRNHTLFGRALYSPDSQIALRVLAYGNEAVDDTFWQSRLGRAVAFRRRLRLDEVTDAYRLVHAEGDGLSGLIVERYADCLVFELFSIGMYQRCQMFAGALADVLGPPRSLDFLVRDGAEWRTVVRADERIERIEGFKVPDSKRRAVGPVTVREHGIRYRVDVSAGHKTGFFCDQRDNRRRFAEFCDGAEVLDLCCYTGGFGLCAKVLGHASEVTSVDLDEKAIAIARKNVNLNQTRINLVHSDAFIYLRQMIANGRQYDCVVCDPSKFAPSRAGIEEALKKYRDLNGLALQVVRPGGVLLTCSCSGLVTRPMFVEAIRNGARYAKRQIQVFDQTGAAADHPVMLNCPESEYLKAVWCRVL
ncbi:MAG: class I SAM-dependent rRNA methyltransferase [Phycisphaerales bacterium]|nr:class I SAM-dependent rRNA methyltransferase [Phycisphaerales bacterium]